jgi:electron transport complex protein RnfG
VDTSLKPRIEQNKLEDTLGQIPDLVPGAARGESMMLGEMLVYRAVDANGRQVGWVVPGSGQGFADRIELLVGMNPEATLITGLYILDQKETPGLGNKVIGEKWRGQFNGKSALAPVTVVKEPPTGNEIKAVTGATVSSSSVTNIVNDTVRRFRAALAALGKQDASKHGE